MSSLSTSYILFILLSLFGIMAISVKKKKITLSGAFTAAGIGLLVLHAGQIRGILMLLSFFLLSIWATAHKKTIKAKLHADNLADQGRNSGQVLANGGVAGLTAILSIIDPQHTEIYIMMMAASLASALADTLSSELRMVYGRRFYHITTFKRETNGLDGVVSLEGLWIGTAGAGIIAVLYAGLNKTALIVLFAGILGNLMDSVLGATLERKNLIGNNMVNFLNTLFAALAALAMQGIFTDLL